MATGMYFGKDGSPQKIKDIYAGGVSNGRDWYNGGVITSGYVGVDGKPRLFYSKNFWEYVDYISMPVTMQIYDNITTMNLIDAGSPSAMAEYGTFTVTDKSVLVCCTKSPYVALAFIHPRIITKAGKEMYFDPSIAALQSFSLSVSHSIYAYGSGNYRYWHIVLGENVGTGQSSGTTTVTGISGDYPLICLGSGWNTCSVTVQFTFNSFTVPTSSGNITIPMVFSEGEY